MNRNEIIEFLSLSSGTPDDELVKAVAEKEKYFKSLVNNAPTSLLKKVYEKNIEKLAEFKTFLLRPSQNFDTPVIKPELDWPEVSNNSSNETQSVIQEPAWLIRHTENSTSIAFTLKQGLNTIGRATEGKKLDVSIEHDMFVSRKHAIIEIIDNAYFLYDVSEIGEKPSKNGVFVNGNDKRLQGKYSLNEGDTLQFGKTKLVFKINTQRTVADVVNEVSNTDYMRTVVINIL
ncbi:FHA domain-containing protein [Flectobacillus major]|jgi:pSer/pThr/pTyr-binding forkhead associated (FHA) protein|uniref:FHA domain-containing protein n=1 Tax=Flectobacillus major TaxID=103 RepID=UPI0003F63713|nr:FHA domain-containing protein [Flectobacillus major]